MNLLYTVVHFETSGEEEEGLVQMRQGIYLDTLDGLMRLTPGQKLKLPFSQVKGILDTEGEQLYFIHDTERSTFLLLYPEYATWNL
jgi:hypothetical protein